MGRADQANKVKGMFVRPEQIAEIGKRHPELGRLRLIVTRAGETDVMTLKAECTTPSEGLQDRLAASLRDPKVGARSAHANNPPFRYSRSNRGGIDVYGRWPKGISVAAVRRPAPVGEYGQP